MAAASLRARSRGYTAFRVLGNNMAPCLRVGEVALFEPIKNVAKLARGTVVAFRIDLFGKAVIPSRIVGFSGETIELREGKLHVDGVCTAEPYLEEGRAQEDFSRNLGQVAVPQ